MALVGEGLGVDIEGRSIFDAVDIEAPSASSTAIIGPSGSGKTTLLNCLGLLLRPTRGRVVLDNRVISGRPRKEVLRFWREDAAFVYQDSGVIDEEALSYNVTLSRRAAKTRHDAVEAVLEKVGLGGRSAERAAVLSGGEKQRLGIARAIYKGASIIFADEPTASLDERNRRVVRDLLFEQAREGTCVIVSTHDLELARACDATLSL